MFCKYGRSVLLLRNVVVRDGLKIIHMCGCTGHFSQSGRFDRLKEVAVEMSFLLKCIGMQ